MNNNMRKIGMMMNVLMGVTMSFILSLVGTATSGHFTVVSWLISFVISLIISLVIGFIVPIKKLGDGACGKCKVEPESMKGTLVSGVVSDLIYTPIITISMVCIMISGAKRQMAAAGITEGGPSIARALPGSLVISLVVGYIVIIIIQPIFIKMLMKKYAGK